MSDSIMQMIVCYIVFGIIWGGFAWEKQSIIYGFVLWRNILCLVLNFVFWPIAMLISMIRGKP